MSLSELIADYRKVWLTGRMESLELDSGLILGSTGSQHISMGFTGAAVLTADVCVQRVANEVFLQLSSASASAGATGTIISTSALPETFRPVSAVQLHGPVVDNSTERLGSVSVATTGIITVGVDLVSGGSVLPGKNFGSSGNNGWHSIDGCYTIAF